MNASEASEILEGINNLPGSVFHSVGTHTDTDTEISFKVSGTSQTVTMSKPSDAQSDNMITTEAEADPGLLAMKLLQKDEEITNKEILQCLVNLLNSHKKDLQTSILDTSTKVAALEIKQQEVCEKVNTLQFHSDNHEDKIQKLTDKVDSLENKLQNLECGLIRRDAVIDELKSKITHVEQQGVKNKLTIYNIDEVDGQENVLLTVANFFRYQMKIQKPVYIQNAYRLGAKKKDTTRPVGVILKSPGEKGKVFGNIKKLKQAKNSKGEKFRIKDTKPPEQHEKRLRQRDIMYKNKRRNTAQRLELSLANGELLIGEEKHKYSCLVEAPDVNTIAELDTKQRQEIMKITLGAGKEVIYEHSFFYGYTITTNDIEVIRKAYIKLRILHGKARHIVCAFQLQNDIDPQSADYVDDEEWGAGRQLLRMLVDAENIYRAVFVVRYHNGPNIGPARFTAYKDAAQSAILLHPKNAINGKVQSPYAVDKPQYPGEDWNNPEQEEEETTPPQEQDTGEGWDQYLAQLTGAPPKAPPPNHNAKLAPMFQNAK